MNHHDLDLIAIDEKAGAQKEREHIVKWLRKLGNYRHDDARANQIEAEEHLK